GALVELAVTRRAGQRSRGEALVINPGGPGGAGLPFAWALAEHLPADVLRLFDVVSWDPRGVGVSNPAIVCPNGAHWADPDLLGRCDRSTGELMAHMSTGNHVDDLEALRMALGGERLNYLGYSYGTYLGAMYANRFPDRVGRFVLDGATHPDAGTPEAPRLGGEPWYAAESLEQVEARFFELCDLAAACELGDDSRVTFLDLTASVAELPTEAFGGEERIDAITLEAVVATSMSDPFNWGVLATALEDAQRGDASTLDALADLLEVSNAYFGEVVDLRESNEAVANPTIYCADFQAVPAAPAYCDGVPANSRASAALGAVEVAEPMLVIGTAFDPNTPGRHAGELADRLGDAVVLYWDGVGHTAFPLNSPCVDDAVSAYLLDGVLPDDGLRCEFVAGAAGDQEIAEYLFALPPAYVEPWIADEIADTWGDDAGCGAERLSVAGDRIVVHVVLGVRSPAVTAAFDKAAAACAAG
ncbi:alpha/beta hydrolase, partial [Ilumatobacter sp.]|uniref:alpha/beta hydrolase n=1 Tax=Ilumatobacter sp. TaxID=1967498 RepID=UPI003AF6BA3F